MSVFHYVFPPKNPLLFFTRFDTSRQLRSSKSYVHQFPWGANHGCKFSLKEQFFRRSDKNLHSVIEKSLDAGIIFRQKSPQTRVARKLSGPIICTTSKWSVTPPGQWKTVLMSRQIGRLVEVLYCRVYCTMHRKIQYLF